jgi:GNAT superfamily N-acetyltransferase
MQNNNQIKRDEILKNFGQMIRYIREMNTKEGRELYNFFDFKYPKNITELKSAISLHGLITIIPDEIYEEEFSKLIKDNKLNNPLNENPKLTLGSINNLTPMFLRNLKNFQITKDFNSPNNTVQIQKVTEIKELENFAKISEECFNDPVKLTVDFFTEVVLSNDKNYNLYLAYKDSCPVGTIILSCVENIYGIYWFGVLETHRKQGIGTELLIHAITEAKKMGLSETIVSQNTEFSKKLFNKIGFKNYEQKAPCCCFNLRKTDSVSDNSLENTRSS